MPAACERVAAARALGQLRHSLLDRAQAEFMDAIDRTAARARASTAAARSAAQNANRAGQRDEEALRRDPHGRSELW